MGCPSRRGWLEKNGVLLMLSFLAAGLHVGRSHPAWHLARMFRRPGLGGERRPEWFLMTPAPSRSHNTEQTATDAGDRGQPMAFHDSPLDASGECGNPGTLLETPLSL